MFNVFLVQGDIETPIDNDHGMGLTVTAATITDLLPWHNYTVKVFCGNVGGFEMGGRETTFTTDIPPPSGTTEGEVSDTMVELSWAVDSLHLTDWYRIEYEMVSGGGKRAAATTVFASQLHGTSVNVTGLVASSTYTIFIYAGKGASYYEPHGTSITVTTLISSGNQANGGLPLGAIIGIIIGGLALVAAVAVAFFILVVRQNRKTASIKRIISQEMSLRSSSSDPRPSIGERRASRVSEGTLLNTNMEISVPGFLLLDAASQFRVEGPLGRGGTATVFKGVLLDADLIQQHATKNIALKRVDPQEKLSGEENKERFLSEVSLMWTCAFHQNVAKFIGFTYEPHKYIVTKLYELDLYTFIHHPTEALPSILALKLSGDISCAVSYMQDMGIVHRDLKTQNILLEEVTMNEKESYLKAVVCDFGLARITSTATVVDSKKTKEVVKGFSPRYAAPEVFASVASVGLTTDAEADKQSDVYSFAIILWELLTRRIPWENLVRDQIELQVRKGTRVSFLFGFLEHAREGNSPFFSFSSVFFLYSPRFHRPFLETRRGRFCST